MRVLKRWQHLTNGRAGPPGRPSDAARPAIAPYQPSPILITRYGVRNAIMKKSKKEPKEALTPQLMVC
jgi:hypothetical protein